MIEELMRGLRGGVRSMRRSPGVSGVIIVTIALTIGANSAVTTMCRAILLKTLPVPQPERLFLLNYAPRGSHEHTNGYVYYAYRDLASQLSCFTGVLARFQIQADIENGEFEARLSGEMVSGNYFSVLGIQPFLGRALTTEDELTPSTTPPIVISHRLWREGFRKDPYVLTRTVRLNRHVFQIVGVSQEGFNGAAGGERADFQIPLSTGPLFQISLERSVWLSLMGRLKANVSVGQAQFTTNATAKAVSADYALILAPPQEYYLDDGSHGFSSLRERLRSPAIILMSSVSLLVLIACANIAGILSARSIYRRREIAIRLALGASRGQVMRQLLFEGVLLALCGGACGIFVSQWTVLSLVHLLRGATGMESLVVEFDVTAAVITIVVSLCSSLLFGLLPAIQVSGINPLAELKGGVGFVATTGGKFAARRALVVVQVALSLVLLCGAGVLAETMRHLETLDLGFQLERRILLTIDPQADGYGDAAARVLVRRLLEEVRQSPMVEAACLSLVAVLSGDESVSDAIPTGGAGGRRTVMVHYIGADYFRTLGTPLLQGREFNDNDPIGAAPPAIVSERFAATYWPNEPAVGKRVDIGARRDVTVVGVAKTSNYRTVREQSSLTVYLPLFRDSVPMSVATLIVHGRKDTRLTLELVRGTIRRIAPALRIIEARTLIQQRDSHIATENALAIVSGTFACLSTILALIGLGGQISLGISTRRREIGVRMAVGADRLAIAGIFAKEAVVMICAGTLIGLPLAWVALTILDSIVFGLPSQDPRICVVGAVAFLVVGLGSVFVPLYRAGKADPVAVLHEE